MKYSSFFSLRISWLTVLAVILLLPSCVNDDDPSAQWALSVGDTLPPFSVTLNDGRMISAQGLRGKTAVIVFFNTTCSDCQKELPVVQQFYDEFKDDADVEILAIAREEDASDIYAYWQKNSLTIPWSPQPDRTIYNLFATSVIPRIFFVNPLGVITAAFGDKDMPDLQTLQEALLTARQNPDSI